jgi:uncharacterized membrane protein YdbT with pleckstrin-like domain
VDPDLAGAARDRHRDRRDPAPRDHLHGDDEPAEQRRGLPARSDRSTHLTRLQNLNTNQSVLARMLRVGSVDFDTAGTDARESDFRFAGVADPHGLVVLVERHLQSQARADAPIR